MEPSSRAQRYTLGIGHCIFAAVFLLRTVALARLTISPLLLPAHGDMHFYDEWARRILQGHLTDHLAFYGLPLYAYTLALIYKLVGYGPFIPALLQAFLDAGTAAILYSLGVRVFPSEPRNEGTASTGGLAEFVFERRGQLIGGMAAMGWAFFAPAQAYAVILMPTAWFVFVFWFVVWRIVRNNSLMGPRECLLLGLLIGITAMGIATILILTPLVLAALFLKPGINNQKRATSAALGAALLIAGIAAGTSPCWIHNYFIARDPVFLSAHSGINFWIGNNPTSNGYPRFPPGLRAGQAAMLEDSITQAEVAAGHPLKRGQVSAYWSGKAKSYIASHVADWLKLLALKLRNFWSAFQYDDLSVITNLREEGVILPGLNFGIVAALAIPGMLLAWWLAPASRWIIAALLLSMFSLLTVFVTERYRLVAVPGLLIFAAFGLSVFWQACMTNRFALLAMYVALLAGSTAFAAWPPQNPSLWALDAYNSGWQALESNNLPLAEKKLALAYAYVPTNSETLFALGNLRLAEHNIGEAQSFYRVVLQSDPQHKGALNNLGVIALEEKRWRDAESFFTSALKQEPRNAKTHYLLAQSHFKAGDIGSAEAEVAEALKLNPAQLQFRALSEEIQRAQKAEPPR